MDEVVVYWAPNIDNAKDSLDWSFLYPKPKTLFASSKEHITKYKDYEQFTLQNSPNVLSCPAVSSKFKKIVVFESPMTCSYKFDQKSQDVCEVIPDTKNFISAEAVRMPIMKHGPVIGFSLYYILFSEEPLQAYFTPPMFHKPGYSKYGSVVPAEYDIGQWFRPYNFEVQMWESKGEFKLVENEPLFYIDFNTNKKIILKRFKMNENLTKLSLACINSAQVMGQGKNLDDKYKKFNDVGMKDLILTDIKKNLIDEESMITI